MAPQVLCRATMQNHINLGIVEILLVSIAFVKFNFGIVEISVVFIVCFEPESENC